MSTARENITDPTVVTPALPESPVPASAERWMTELNALLRELESVSSTGRTLPPVFTPTADDQLVRVRLGVAAGLFAALQCKNAAVAGHALRVSLSCSAWAVKMKMPEAERESIELAALLHDVGMIGAPDHVLLKPTALDCDETAVMARARKMSQEILRRSCASEEILEIVENISAWYDGSRTDFPLHGRNIPLGSRIIAIVEAFDAMTTDHVYRPARSHERALAELFECAGSQFDPELVRLFAEFCRDDQTTARWETAHRWLRTLNPASANAHWGVESVSLAPAEPTVGLLFQGRLLDNMYDAVVFVDATGRIVLWNRGAERLTGIGAVSVRGHLWRPELLNLCDEKSSTISKEDCPVHTAISTGVQSLRRLKILGRSQKTMAVDAHAIPVIDQKGVTQGAVLLFHDASSEISLERRCQRLHEKSTKDPMTKVANRAELDRVHEMFVAAHRQQEVPCSLMMFDMDRFKLVNDTYGHQAGDDAIMSLVSLLKSSCRPGDLVARYGGEEFVVLCADCDVATAARRADQIRKSLSQISQPRMDGRAVTVSAGVTEIQPGDTPDTMLRRADRALLLGKDKGRNTVVQLGAGGDESDESTAVPRQAKPKQIYEQDLITPVPVKMAVEKLRGFVADHQARITSINGNRVCLEIAPRSNKGLQGRVERPIPMLLEVLFEEQRLQNEKGTGANGATTERTRTKINVVVGPRTDRDRRRNEELDNRASELINSFRAYLMAAEESESPASGTFKRIKRIIAPWLTR